MRKLFSLILVVFIFSCKSKKAITEEGVANKELSSIKIIQGHYKNEKDFKTIAIRANAKYKDESQSHSVNADIRIKKDEIIWINVKILGFPVAKVLITPEKVSYYEKLNNTYFEGDFSVLSNWLGTDLDFYKVQNLLLGSPVDNLKKEKYETEIENNLYKLFEKERKDTQKEFYFEASNFLLKKEALSQVNKNRELEINYPSHQKQMNIFIPNEIQIKAIQKEEINIALFYKSITFNEDLNFSFSIPEGYEMVTID
ncbi:DUF4292 domain-containing protein [Flavobacterium jejuense]|uniref:DUF4292 domain-containing protein n=1 Tax=Flavobacterium jejuense TaxID=1544455 RepID=A0ABX0IPJ6_9FLAO|nr:DUF4292 domain-containing protein [Flavobacterium jejuense]NHN25730.1 DUF4292 domain-containing protein [Flavobacterium jejuense]